jgi:threonine/homoserine/homoserine lactone efflux protein
MNLEVLLQGLIAGYGIAIPVGPIGILIIELGIRRGFGVAFCAGLGAASADLIYASVAALAGTFLVSILAPISSLIHYVSALALITIGVWLFYQGRRFKRTEQRTPRGTSAGCVGTYGLFFGLTLLNPLTVTYFTSLILGLRIIITTSALDVLVFVAATFLASLSWQTLLACVSGLSHRRLSPGVQEATFALGNCVVIALGLLILLGFNI